MPRESDVISELSPYERWMVKSNLETIATTDITAEQQASQLQANGYHRVAEAVRVLAPRAQNMRALAREINADFERLQEEAEKWRDEQDRSEWFESLAEKGGALANLTLRACQILDEREHQEAHKDELGSYLADLDHLMLGE